jgi:Fe-S-cluster containining protein
VQTDVADPVEAGALEADPTSLNRRLAAVRSLGAVWLWVAVQRMAENLGHEADQPDQPGGSSFGDDVDTVPQCTGRCCDPVTVQAEMYWEMSRAPGAYRNGRYILSMLRHQGAVPRHGVVEFTCRYFDQDTRRCVAYDRRPGMCREYPESGFCGYCGGRFATGTHAETSDAGAPHAHADRQGVMRMLLSANPSGTHQSAKSDTT